MAKKSKAEKKAEKAAEQARLEAERLEAERVEAERLEAERIERERQERIRKELERVRKTKEAETLAETYHSALPPAGVLVEIHRIYNGDSFSLAARQQAQSNRESISVLHPPPGCSFISKLSVLNPNIPRNCKWRHRGWPGEWRAQRAGGTTRYLVSHILERAHHLLLLPLELLLLCHLQLRQLLPVRCHPATHATLTLSGRIRPTPSAATRAAWAHGDSSTTFFMSSTASISLSCPSHALERRSSVLTLSGDSFSAAVQSSAACSNSSCDRQAE